MAGTSGTPAVTRPVRLPVAQAERDLLGGGDFDSRHRGQLIAGRFAGLIAEFVEVDHELLVAI
jgi:hypothetical protein